MNHSTCEINIIVFKKSTRDIIPYNQSHRILLEYIASEKYALNNYLRK